MTFLNPFVLIGLIAAAIPVILHLLNLRKLRTIEFSTLTFLKELQQTKIRRLKLRQILLLITRTLLVIFIVLAFARPALRGTILGNLGSQAHSSIVFILDDSFSMTGTDEHGEYFKQAKETTIKLIDFLKAGDEVFLIKLSDLPNATINPATHDYSALRAIIQECQISSIRRPLDDALRLSAKLLQRSTNANKEIYIISDLQQTLLLQQSHQIKNNNLSFFDERVQFFFVPIGSKEIANVSIDSLNVTTTILEKDKPLTILASIRNFGNTPLSNYVVSAYIDGVKSAQQNVNVGPWTSAETELIVIPKRIGFIKGYLELENDAIELDNRRYFTLYIPERINIMLIANNETDKQFVLTALQSSDAQTGQSLFNIQQIVPQKFPFADLKNTDVIVCSNVKSFSSNDVGRIQEFVESGGGIVLFPGDDIQKENYNTTLLPALHIPPIDYLPPVTARPANLSFQKVDLDHPLFATMLERERSAKEQKIARIETPNIIKSLQRQAGKQSRIIITLSDGTPFLSEYNFGKGKILFYSIAPSLPWSDFPLRGIFAPLIYRSMVFVSANDENNNSYIAGDEPTITLRKKQPETNRDQFSTVSPDGIEELTQPTASSANQTGTIRSDIFTPHRLATPGFYEIRYGNNSVFIFGVNTDRLESDIRIIARTDLTSDMKRLGIESNKIHFCKPGEPLQTVILQTRFGVELWKYFVGLALFLSLIEMLIARDSRKASRENS
jgi:hypothetical protein